jgi:hypothetical protein
MRKKLILILSIGLANLIFVSIFVLIFVNGTQINCVREADQTYTCGIQTLLLGKYPIFRQEITRVVDAHTVDSPSGKRLFRTEFITADGKSFPLTAFYSNTEPHDRRVAELHSQFKSGESSFEYYIEPLWWILYLVGGLALTDFLALAVVFGRGLLQDYLVSRDKIEEI